MTHELRVLSWNVRDMLGDPLAVHRVLRAAQADVACLQEAPRLVANRNQLSALARKAGMLYVAGGRAAAGTALLVRLRVDVHEARAERLPVAGWRTRPRGWTRAQVGIAGSEPVCVASIHLGLDEAERADHVRQITAELARTGRPAVVAGDLNERPGGPSWQGLGHCVADPAPGAGPTFPASRPRSRIDAVLCSPGLDVTGYGAPDGLDQGDVVLASDHQPVLATVRLPAAS